MWRKVTSWRATPTGIYSFFQIPFEKFTKNVGLKSGFLLDVSLMVLQFEVRVRCSFPFVYEFLSSQIFLTSHPFLRLSFLPSFFISFFFKFKWLFSMFLRFSHAIIFCNRVHFSWDFFPSYYFLLLSFFLCLQNVLTSFYISYHSHLL